jgi:type III restriction enzyme
MPEPFVNISALEPLFAPHEEPNRHRVRAEEEGKPARVVTGRRRSDIAIAQNFRPLVKTWRENDYPGASDTTRELLHHWFERDHLIALPNGEQIPFRYFFCQREAIETLIYAYEVRGMTTLSGLVAEFTGEHAETAALGVNPEQDRWPKYAFKLATGTGKTKVMSLAIVWSYFHALRESGSALAKHFVIIAPNLTVFERLKADFKPAEGGKDIFDNDPLIPVAWRGDWNLSVVLQDEASGAATGGTLFLTNIHRLYDTSERRKKQAETYDFIGPAVSRAKALDTGAELRKRITEHYRVMVLNDEAHHLWDPDSAANEAIEYLHETIEAKRGEGLVAQLDFSATPKDNSGRIFQHVVCDTPLGEAVDSGIVKTPIIGRGKRWEHRVQPNAADRFQEQLMVGYARWQKSNEEWKKSGKKPLLFVMTEDTQAADEIAHRLNTDSLFRDLNGKTTNLHTNLKGKIKFVGGKKHGYPVFEESEKEISDEDLKALRELSRKIDSDENPYACIVSVLMLREGWDVRNVTTIIPLRPYTSKANILPEQTLGRGLRRMTPPGSNIVVAEVVTVVEHPAFSSLYREQLSQEGLEIEEVEVEDVPTTTVTIYVDKEKKDVTALDLQIPSLSAGFLRIPKLELTIEDVRKAFSRYPPLKLTEPRTEEVEYEGRALLTNEVVERMKIQLPLLQNPVGAIAFFRDELETMTGIKGTHPILAPLIETFLTEMLFAEKVDLFDARLLSRLSAQDVREYIRATFVPLIQKRTTVERKRLTQRAPTKVSNWRPFQVTHSQDHPAIPAKRTLFNLVPCNRELEVAMASFLDKATDVAAFCKNAGPQALRLDYVTDVSRLAFYTPDFIARSADGKYRLIETKGRIDKDVPLKVAAAVDWCKAASKQMPWDFLYVPEGVFQRFAGETLSELETVCATHRADLLAERVEAQFTLPLGEVSAEDINLNEFISADCFDVLPPRYQKGVEQAVSLFRHLEHKTGVSFAPPFTALLGALDEAARGLMIDLLGPDVPEDPKQLEQFFEANVSSLPKDEADQIKWNARNLKGTIVDRKGTMPIGVLRWSLNYAKSPRQLFGGIFDSIKNRFAPIASKEFVKQMEKINGFRNTYVAHQEQPLEDVEQARAALKEWAAGLCDIWKAHH